MDDGRGKHAHQQSEKSGIDLVVALVHLLEKGGSVNTRD
jgi:hypothetical protein